MEERSCRYKILYLKIRLRQFIRAVIHQPKLKSYLVLTLLITTLSFIIVYGYPHVFNGHVQRSIQSVADMISPKTTKSTKQLSKIDRNLNITENKVVLKSPKPMVLDLQRKSIDVEIRSSKNDGYVAINGVKVR